MVKELETEHKMGKMIKYKRIWIQGNVKREAFENIKKLKRDDKILERRWTRRIYRSQWFNKTF